tara:strand:- start:1047 stop:1232 length:186 start_codon:yes stop_codon:yes gene_type:complete
MEGCKFKKGDLVTFRTEYFIGIVEDVMISDAFEEEGLYEVKVLWVDYRLSFWCIEHALKKM